MEATVSLGRYPVSLSQENIQDVILIVHDYHSEHNGYHRRRESRRLSGFLLFPRISFLASLLMAIGGSSPSAGVSPLHRAMGAKFKRQGGLKYPALGHETTAPFLYFHIQKRLGTLLSMLKRGINYANFSRIPRPRRNDEVHHFCFVCRCLFRFGQIRDIRLCLASRI